MLAVFGVLWLAGRGMGLGFGDVKLAPPLGVLTAWFSWTTFAVSVYATVLTAAAYGIGLLVLGRGQRGTTFAYGPFMIFGTVAAVLVAS